MYCDSHNSSHYMSSKISIPNANRRAYDNTVTRAVYILFKLVTVSYKYCNDASYYAALLNAFQFNHAGPLYCCDTPLKKYWVLLFTCGVVRAVHLELVDTLSTYDTVLAFRRLVARRGLPKVIYSDNAKGFVEADHRPRLQWPLGIITQVFPGKDGLIRTLEVKTS